MNIKEAIEIAMKENKEIALPTDEQCSDDGYRLRIKPYPNNLQLLEFYGIEMKINKFSINPNELIRNDWMIV